jgi:hypothetical protein
LQTSGTGNFSTTVNYNATNDLIDLGHGQYTNQVVIAGNYVDTTGATGAIGATGSTPHPSCAAGSSLTGNVDMVSGNPVNFYYSNTSTNC